MKLISTREAANILCCSERKIRNLIARGLLQATRIGEKVYRLREDEVERAKALPMLRPNPDRVRLQRPQLLMRDDLKIQRIRVYWSGVATNDDATMFHAALEDMCNNLAQTSNAFFFCRNVAQIESFPFMPAPESIKKPKSFLYPGSRQTDQT